MDIREKILEIRTVDRDKQKTIEYFLAHPQQLKELIQLVLELEPYPYKEYGSWILTHLCQSGRFDLQHLYPYFVDLLFITKDQSVLRNVLRSLNFLEISEYRESEFIDLLIRFIQDYSNKVALQVYSIYMLIPFVNKYPELKSEVLETIDFHSKNKTAAYTIARRNFVQSTSID